MRLNLISTHFSFLFHPRRSKFSFLRLDFALEQPAPCRSTDRARALGATDIFFLRDDKSIVIDSIPLTRKKFGLTVFFVCPGICLLTKSVVTAFFVVEEPAVVIIIRAIH